MVRTHASAILLGFLYSVHSLSSLTDSASRRDWLRQTTGAAGIFLVGSTTQAPPPAKASEQELPDVLRKISLAPLGKPQAFASKSLNLPLEELASRLTRDLTVGANGSGGYFLTGDLSTDIFKDDCVFSDPTNNVASLSRYQNALRILFDPASSEIQLLSPQLTIHADTQPKTISGRIRSRGYIQLPWRPYVSAYESDIVYTIDDETGLIARQDQVWDNKSPSKALRESFTPSSFLFNQPPPKSNLMPSSAEPKVVSRLFGYINGRRPNEYTSQERKEIEALIQELVVDTETTNQQPEFQRELLPGRWILAYLQPGPDGVGIDRRIPFPDFDFNDNYQVFGSSSSQVTNIGQVLGPWIDVKVSGTLQEGDPSSTRIPKRFQANIEGGKLCVYAGSDTEGACVGLPIQGEGLFDSLYLGERLRVGQNINGGGARVVQIRLD